MKTKIVRQNFLSYFEKNKHRIYPSSPTVPHDDPTLLFTNAGMNQFKDLFLGKTSADFTRAATSQKCIRAGGKHNDLENVGHTSRHCTFFEMLGNFSFGDYFKEDAIKFAWEVSTEVFGFDPDRIWPTVFRDDDEAAKLWTRYVPESRITRFGEKDNFWAMGDTGPCGPCSELLYDRGEKFGSASCPSNDPSGERFLEFWNLVFMQFNRRADGTMEPLPKPSIDTGAGLERVMSLTIGVDNVFETDILRGLIASVEEFSKIKYDITDTRRSPAFRVIADHIRSLSFAIADGAQPSNIERGYVLRKILRRAVRYGKMLGFEDPFLGKLLPSLITLMGEQYPELAKSQSRIQEILVREEEAFFKTLKRGGNILNNIIEQTKKENNEISGEDAFKLKDTYGLPLEEILLIAKDSQLSVDVIAYQELERGAKERSKQAHKTVSQGIEENLFKEFVLKEGESTFVREDKEALESRVIGIISQGEFKTSLEAGQEGELILKETLFYPEMGGQLGDTGVIMNDKVFFEVSDTKAPYKGVISHAGKLARGTIRLGDTLKGSVDAARRKKIACNHTATHLLHWALHSLFGESLRQAGSLVDDKRLRFDFSHHKQLTDEEIQKVELLVNEKIRENIPVACYELSFDEARKKPEIKQFFGEKYGSTVRVVDIDMSKELCGGTHTKMTGDIGYFRICREMSIAAGIRRIEAVTGNEAELFTYATEDLVKKASELMKTPQHKLLEKIVSLQEEVKVLHTEIESLKHKRLETLAGTLQESTSKGGVPTIVAAVSVVSSELKTLGDLLAKRYPNHVILLGTKDDVRAYLFIRSPEKRKKEIKASALLAQVLPDIDGNGGGKEDFAQGAGKKQEALEGALQKLTTLF